MVVEVRAIVTGYRGQSPAPLPSLRRVGDFRGGAAGHGCSAQPCPRPAKTGQTAHASRAGRRRRAIDAARRGESHIPRAVRRRVCVLPRCCQVGEIGSTHPGPGVPGHVARREGADIPRCGRARSAGTFAPSSLNASCTRLQLTLAGRQTMVLQTIAPRRCQRTRARGASNLRPRQWRLAMEPDAGSSRHPLRSGGDGDEDLAQLCRERAGVGGDGDGCRVRRVEQLEQLEQLELERRVEQRKRIREQEPDHDRRVAVAVGRFRGRRAGIPAWLRAVGGRPEREGRPARAARSSWRSSRTPSSPAQVVTNYQRLIGSDKDPLVFGPFSTLLTVRRRSVAARYGYAFVEGAGGGAGGIRDRADTTCSTCRSRSRTTWRRSPTGWLAAGGEASQDGRLRDGQRPVHPAAVAARAEDPEEAPV